MHRDIDVFNTTKVEYAEFKSEADMNIYEIYFINLWKPRFNCDDKAPDDVSVTLPDVKWIEFTIKLMDKWKKEITDRDLAEKIKKERSLEVFKEKQELRIKKRSGELTEDEYWNAVDSLDGLKV